MVLFFVDEITPRWIYTLDFVFKTRKLNFQITDELEIFEKYDRPKINFTSSPSELSFFTQSPILDNNDLRTFEIEKGSVADVECIKLNGVTDLLGSIFFILSRYEEYQNPKRDQHGRFSAMDDSLYRFNWIKTPVCDIWAESFLRLLSGYLGVQFALDPLPARIIPTFDIDNTYAYLHKQGGRKWFSILKDLVQFNFSRIKERRLVLAKKIKDPYNTFDSICSIFKRGFSVKIFWLVGDYGQYDRNLSTDYICHRELIKKMAQHAQLGIHPSYQSNQRQFKVKQELTRLQDIVVGLQKVKISRQHFLKLSLPETYHNLIKYNIKEDFTMGFADSIGFRVGTAHKLQWFDLENDKISALRLRPLLYMDGTLNEYMKLTPEQAKNEIEHLYNEVKKYGGDFTFLWHNETIGNYGKWNGWRDVMEFTLNLENENT